MARNIDVFEQTDVEGKSLGSGRIIVSLDQLAIDIYEIKPLRGSSYIPTPANSLIRHAVL